MHPNRITSAADAKAFTFAGNAIFTLVSQRTAARFTFKVRAPEKPGSVGQFVSVLNGSDNEGDYAYLGHIWAENRVYTHGRKSKIGQDAPSAKAFDWFYRHMMRGDIPAGIEVWHEGRCGRCARLLTVPESIKRGIGPDCAAQMGIAFTADAPEDEDDTPSFLATPTPRATLQAAPAGWVGFADLASAL